jgi:hypothetical protein
MKARICIVLSLFLVTFFSTNLSSAGENGFGLTYNNIKCEIKDMPEEIRNVPIHEDDGYANPANAGPIEKRYYELDGFFSLDWFYRKDIGDKLWLDFGINWLLCPLRSVGLRNYTNAVGTSQRGYGAALTFAALQMRGPLPPTGEYIVDFLFNWTPQVAIGTPLDKEKNFKIGISASYYRLCAVNGWDRYDRYETKDYYTLAHIVPITLALNIHNMVTLGVSYNLNYPSSQGSDAGTEIDKLSYILSLKGTW